MSSLYVDEELIEDQWRSLSDEEPLPHSPFIVSFARWRSSSEAIIAHALLHELPLGLRLTLDDDALELGDAMAGFALVAIDLTDPSDGRIFSVAARIRETLGYRRELRVCGQIPLDQVSFLRRCGVNAFKFDGVVQAQDLFSPYERYYQTGVDAAFRLDSDERGCEGVLLGTQGDVGRTPMQSVMVRSQIESAQAGCKEHFRSTVS